MKNPPLTASNSLKENHSQLFELFEDLDQKIDHLSDESIENLIAAAQMIVKNNHTRLMNLDHSKPNCGIDITDLRISIEQESHFLAGTVLPMLYKQI